MKRLILMTIVVVLLSGSSCRHDGTMKRPAPSRRIPDNTLVDILTDTYLTSGMLDLYAISITWGRRDSTLNYIDVIESHGYTWDQFDATMRYYFNSKPKKLSKIFDRVTGNLLELETTVMTESRESPPPEENLWPGKLSYSFPEESARDPIWFDIPISEPGQYVLRAEIRLFDDDRSRNPRVTAYFSYTDISGEERRDYWKEAPLKKDGQFHTIELQHTIENISGVRLRGWLLNHDNQTGQWEKHSRITNISIVHSGETMVY